MTFSACLMADKKLYVEKNELIYVLDKNDNKISYFIIYIICYPIALYLASISNWTYGERTGLIPSLSAYFKNIITVLTIVFFSFKNMKQSSKLLFMFLYLIITFKSTQRTNFLIVALAYVYTIKNSKKVFKLGLLSIFALLVLGAARNGVSIFNLAYPIFGEGLFGSWGTLNSINEIQKFGFNTDNLLRFFNGFLNFFLKFFNLSLPELSFELTSKGIDYYPMGGFFFLSDAILFNPIAGPILYTTFIYVIYSFGYKRLLKKRTAEYLLYMGLLFEFIKASQSTIMAMFAFHFLFLFLLRCVDTFVKFACKNNKDLSYA